MKCRTYIINRMICYDQLIEALRQSLECLLPAQAFRLMPQMDTGNEMQHVMAFDFRCRRRSAVDACLPHAL